VLAIGVLGRANIGKGRVEKAYKKDDGKSIPARQSKYLSGGIILP
jgi:hypothetical protein